MTLWPSVRFGSICEIALLTCLLKRGRRAKPNKANQNPLRSRGEQALTFEHDEIGDAGLVFAGSGGGARQSGASAQGSKSWPNRLDPTAHPLAQVGPPPRAPHNPRCEAAGSCPVAQPITLGHRNTLSEEGRLSNDIVGSIFHGAREGEFMASRFRLWELRYSATTGVWLDQERSIDNHQSYVIHLDGSGHRAIASQTSEWIGTPAEGTSRAAIWFFCDALHSRSDPFSGGAPQLVGIWRKGPGRSFGFLWHGRRYLAGLEVPNDAIWSSVDWFNHLFERCDGKSGRRLKDAQPQRKPDQARD